jgi:hypothetical protein
MRHVVVKVGEEPVDEQDPVALKLTPPVLVNAVQVPFAEVEPSWIHPVSVLTAESVVMEVPSKL